MVNTQVRFVFLQFQPYMTLTSPYKNRSMRMTLVLLDKSLSSKEKLKIYRLSYKVSISNEQNYTFIISMTESGMPIHGNATVQLEIRPPGVTDPEEYPWITKTYSMVHNQANQKSLSYAI